MTFSVNEHCIGCDLCVEVCPDVFFMTKSGSAEAIQKEVPEFILPDALNAMINCPAFAIEKMA